MTILENDGNQGFVPRQQDVGESVEPVALAATDLNFDGFSDLVLASNGSKDLRFLLNRGDGTFHVHAILPLPANATSIAAARLDDDDREDIAVALETGEVLLFFRFPGNGTFSVGAPRPFFIGPSARDVLLADMNGDGQLDVTAVNQGNEVVCLPARN